MNAELTARLIESSDAYSSVLWDRFVHNKPLSTAEQELFQRIHRDFDVKNASLSDIRTYLADPKSGPLMETFFHPGATDDVYINYHPAYLNEWVHAHDFFEIIYVARGSTVDWIDGTRVCLQANELCIHNPNARHQILKMDEGRDLVLNILLPTGLFQRAFYSLLMENEELDQFFNYYRASSDNSPNYMAFHQTTGRVETIMELLVEEFLRGENSSRFVMESTLVVLFGELMRNYRSDPFVRELVGYISGHLATASMQGAAEHFGYHKNYFPHVVKKHSARSFWELVTDIRIQKASNLLLFTDSSIEDISAEVGYKSAASFYEQFFKRYQMTPNEYRRSERGAGGAV